MPRYIQSGTVDQWLRRSTFNQYVSGSILLQFGQPGSIVDRHSAWRMQRSSIFMDLVRVSDACSECPSDRKQNLVNSLYNYSWCPSILPKV